MSLNNARRFVEKMREDQSFRNKALQTTGQEDLSSGELVVAMAECMAQLEMQTCC
jgi:hypothetical protein